MTLKLHTLHMMDVNKLHFELLPFLVRAEERGLLDILSGEGILKINQPIQTSKKDNGR